MEWIDLRSDTVTQQTQAMRDAMLTAEVGDDVYVDDPTINELEKMAAKVFGKEAALFVPSGTMGNQLAIMTHTARGDEIIVGAESHIFMHEVGAAAVLSGVNLRSIEFHNAVPEPERIERAIRPDDIHEPRTTLICLENALANGRVVPLSVMEAVHKIAKKHKLPVHLDGARLFNAAAAFGVEVREITRHVDSVQCCLSKGLCAPVGGILAGSREFVAQARRYRKMLGGGMRQAGFLAAAGIIALRDMPARLTEDHENARYLAERLLTLPGVSLDREAVQINMVFFTLDAPQKVRDELPAYLLKKGIKICGEDAGEFRFVTNHGVSRADLDTVIDCMKTYLS